MAHFQLPTFLLTVCLLLPIAAKSKTAGTWPPSQDYQVVRPRILETRNRRSIVEQEDILYVELNNWVLRTFHDDRLVLSPNLLVEWSNSTESRQQPDCQLRQGHVEDDSESFVVLTMCKSGVYALIMLGKRSFFVEPLGNEHVLYETNGARFASERKDDVLSVTKGANLERIRRKKRELTTEASPEYRNLSGDVFDFEYPEAEKLILYDDRDVTGEEEEATEEPVANADAMFTSYFSGFPSYDSKPIRKKNVKESPPRWLELGIAADYSVIEFHGSRVQEYILALLNIVSAIYMDPSLASNMVLVVVRMTFYAEKSDGMIRRGDARRSLENVNKWNRKMLSLSERGHDIGVWLTRLDIGGPSGYAPVSGVCDPARSCALNRDEGLTSAFIIAHEVAHILGLSHDGDASTGNTCSEEAKRGSVMAPMVAATFHHFYWSACSKKEFHRRVRRWSCLLNQPKDRTSTELKSRVRETFTMDEQCRMEFGDGYELCKTFDVDEPCSHLWCGNTNLSSMCKTKKGPPLDGTICGESKWCISGRCKPSDSRSHDLSVVLQKPRDGGWGSWSTWEKCSRTCGVAVQCRSRRCNKPPPAYGGKYCSGAHEDCKVCRLPKCSPNVDLRLQQCQQIENVLHSREMSAKGNVIGWLPYETNQENLKCQLICRSKETGEVVYTRRSLMDGTPCSYGSTDICIRGECQRMGCDNVLGSAKTVDVCGVCDGDGTNCENIISKFQRKLRRDITRIIIIPRKARNMLMNITLLEGTFDENNISVVIGDGRKRRNVEESLASRVRDTAVLQGAIFRIRIINNNTVTVKQAGTTFEDVVILLVISKKQAKLGINTMISLQYYINRLDTNRKTRYVWTPSGWSFCSVSCGGGTRHKMILCKDEKTDRIVSRRKCSLSAKPNFEFESCNNFNCSFKWLPGLWEECSTTCGSSGVQLRQLYCIHSDFSGTEVNRSNELEVYRNTVRSSMCRDNPKPITSRDCNRTPCPGRWIFTDWSSCSGSYDLSIQSRIAHCIPPDKEILFDCGGTLVKTEIRPCDEIVKSTRVVKSTYSCWKDKSEFCSLPGFKRYCNVPRFRRHCCRTCEIDDT